jgi:hypothetical protein
MGAAGVIAMLTTVQGIYKNGKVELLEPAPDVLEARVYVTFVPAGKEINLADHGIGPEQAADLRARLATFAEDWDRPEMDDYNALEPR